MFVWTEGCTLPRQEDYIPCGNGQVSSDAFARGLWEYAMACPQFSVEGIAVVTFENGHKGYIDRDCHLVFKKEFLWAGHFSEGLARVKFLDRTFGYISKYGRRVFKSQKFERIEDFKGGQASVRFADGHWGYINSRGQERKTGYA